MKALTDPCMLLNIALLLLLVLGCKKAPMGTFHDDALSLGNAKALQGFCAMAIVLHHISQRFAYDLNRPVPCWGWILNGGVFLTAFFFFFSGYGLLLSYQSKENYLHNFLKKRLTTVLVPFYIAELLFLLISFVADGPFSLAETLLYATGIVLSNAHLWYIVEICVLYVAFYKIFRRSKSTKRSVLYMLLFVLALICFSVLLGHDFGHGHWFMGEWWFNTVLCFPLGMLIALYWKPILAFVKKHYVLCLAISILLFIGLHFASAYMQATRGYYTETSTSRGTGDKFLTLLLQAPEVVLCVVTVLLLSLKLRFCNQALRFIGSFALELYVSHNIFVYFLLYLFPRLSPFLYALICYALAIPTAYLLHRLCERIKKPLLERLMGPFGANV